MAITTGKNTVTKGEIIRCICLGIEVGVRWQRTGGKAEDHSKKLNLFVCG